MNCESGRAFESIESAQEFVALLVEAIAEAKEDVSADVEREMSSGISRRVQALQVALYNLEKLELHVKTSRRILNDLRILRRLLCQERAATPLNAAPKLTTSGIHKRALAPAASPTNGEAILVPKPLVAA